MIVERPCLKQYRFGKKMQEHAEVNGKLASKD